MPTPDDCLRCGQPIPPAAPGGECPACLLRLALDVDDPAADPTAAEVQAALPHLVVEDRVGRGGAGVVFRARQPELDRVVAVKWLAADRAADPAFVERFVREAKALARLDHPNIVRVYESGRAAGSAYLVMEYVPGGSLRDRLADKTLTPADALRLVPQLCEAVGYAHDRGVVHRDLKPENVLLDDAGRVKVADFGLAKFDGDEFALTGSGERLGTARYMAPEQWAAAAVDHRADLYSLGVLFYELLTGDLPAPQYEPPSRKAGTGRRLDKVVSKSLRPRPADRYQRAAEMKSDVERAGRRRWWPWLLLAAAIVAVLVWASGGRQPPEGQPPPAIAPQGADAPRSPSAEDPLTDPELVWSPPVNLGPPINSADHDTHACPTPDGLGLYFRSTRPGGHGDGDLYFARRPAPDAAFGEPVNLGPAVNSPQNDEGTTLTADSLLMAFVSDRGGENDVYLSTRPTPAAPWGEAESAGPAVNSASHEYRPWLSADGLTLTFSSLRPPQPGLYRSTRKSRSDPFDPAEPYAPNAERLSVGQASFSADGKTVLVHRYNRDFAGDLLWLARITDPARPLLGLKSFGPVVNAGIDTHPAPAWDGYTVFFESDRDGGSGAADLWLTRRVPKP